MIAERITLSPTLEESLETFLRVLEGKNRSQATITAYQTDLRQFVTWLHANNDVATTPADVAKADISEYLAELAHRQISGVSRARKLAALREFFRHLVEHEILDRSPAATVQTPKKERKGRTFLSQTEYNKMLVLAAPNIRDYCILQVFLQTGLRVTELCNLRIEDIDVDGRMLYVRAGKGNADRSIELEPKVIKALKNYLKSRPQVIYPHLFLNKDNEPFSRQGIGKLVRRYREEAGITKRVSPHGLRHTFATAKAVKGVSPYQLQNWLGHAKLDSTQIYVHIGRQNAQRVMEATSL